MLKRTHARDPGLWDRLVNDKWGGAQPILSPEESIVAARKLYRHAMGKPFPGQIELTSGNRYTWARYRRGKGWVLSVNPDKRERDCRGLRALIHDMSHYCHSKLHPGDSAHSPRQARLEGRLVNFALDRGWPDGSLRRAPPPPKERPDVVRQRYDRMVNRRDKWAREIERAKRLHAKAAREVKAYERRHGARVL